VVGFAASLLISLGYSSQTRCARIRKELPLTVCGEPKFAKPDVYLLYMYMSNNTILLLVQDDKHVYEKGCNALAQLLAEAVGVFRYNNGQRHHAAGLPAQHEMVEKWLPPRTSYKLYLNS
jgi:hypothetical protein